MNDIHLAGLARRKLLSQVHRAQRGAENLRMLLAHSVLLDALEIKRSSSVCSTSSHNGMDTDYAVPSEFGGHDAESEYFKVMDTVDVGEWDAWCGIEEGGIEESSDGEGDSDEEEQGGIEP